MWNYYEPFRDAGFIRSWYEPLVCKAASRFGLIFGDDRRAKEYEAAARDVKDAMLRNLYDEEAGRFLKMMKPDGSFTTDLTVDSSVYGIFEPLCSP